MCVCVCVWLRSDLKAAHGALSSCAEFFANLSVYATRQRLKETAVIERLNAAPF